MIQLIKVVDFLGGLEHNVLSYYDYRVLLGGWVSEWGQYSLFKQPTFLKRKGQWVHLLKRNPPKDLFLCRDVDRKVLREHLRGVT